MGLIRGSLVFVVGILLLISLLVGNLFLTLNISVTPENVKENLASKSNEIIESIGEQEIDEVIEEKLPAIESYCQNHTEFVFSYEDYPVDIPCETVREGKDAIIEEGISDVVDEVYYKEYECKSFWKCVFGSDNPTYLISKEAKQSWSKIFYYSLAVSLILIAIMFFLVSIANLFIITGALLFISSLPFAVFDKILSLFNNSFLKIIPFILSASQTIFLISLILGITLVGIGFSIKFLNLGAFVVNIFGKK